jgi:protein-tyrosine phosphatase
MDAVTNSLLVGDADDADDTARVRDEAVTTVLSLTHETPPSDGYAVVDCPLVDGPRHDPAAFAAAVEELESRLAAGERVLVHCSAGASRSVAVAAAALALTAGVDVDAALDRVCAARGVAAPHPALADRARQYVADRRDSR